MRRFFARGLLVAACLHTGFSPPARAASPTLDLAFLPSLAVGDAELWTQFDYFHPKLDVFSFNQHASTSSRLEESSTIKMGGNYRFSESLDLRAVLRYQAGRITRQQEPKNMRSEAYGYRVSADWRFLRSKRHELALWGAWEQNHAKNIQVDKYGHRGVVLGEDVQLLDPSTLEPLPVVELGAKDKGLAVGLMGVEHLSRATTLHAALSFRWSQVEATSESVLFSVEDAGFLAVEFNGIPLQDLLDSFRAELPQKSPWIEKATTLDLGVGIRPNKFLSVLAKIRQHFVSRKNYETNPKKKDYATNTIADLYVFMYPARNLSIYLHAMASTHYVLGEQPFAYNRRVNHVFENKYGIVSIGAAVGF